MSQVVFSCRMVEYIMLYSYNGMLHSNENKLTSFTQTQIKLSERRQLQMNVSDFTHIKFKN